MRPWWREKERDLAKAGLPNPYKDLDLMSKNIIKGPELKKLKVGKRMFNESHMEEKEKRITEVTTASKSGVFSPCRDGDILTEVLGNPKHRGRVHGISSRKSWKTMDS